MTERYNTEPAPAPKLSESALETMPQIAADHGGPTRREPTGQAVSPHELAPRG